MSDLVTPGELAEALEVSVETIRRFCRRGDIKAELYGRSWIIQYADAETFIQEYRRGEWRHRS